jgi:hypothetical protein
MKIAAGRSERVISPPKGKPFRRELRRVPVVYFNLSLISRLRLCLTNSTPAARFRAPKTMAKKKVSSGGKAEASGSNYETLVTAWHAHAVLLGGAAHPPFDLHADTRIISFACQSDAPVDDVNAITSDAGIIFVQAKRSEAKRKHEFGRQFELRGRARPIRSGVDSQSASCAAAAAECLRAPPSRGGKTARPRCIQIRSASASLAK